MTTNKPCWSDKALEALVNAIAALQRKARVLLVEDDPMQAAFMQECISIYPSEITIKASSREAILAIIANKYDVVFLDLKLRGNHGLDVLRNAKLLIDPPPILVVTAFAHDEDAESARALGAVTIMDKPLSHEFLRALFGRIHA